MRKTIELEDAISICCRNLNINDKVELINVEQGFKRVVAGEIKALCDFPSYTRSMVDGYALNSEDFEHKINIKYENTMELEIIDEVPAGKAIATPLLPGQCARVMTGALLSEGTGGVIKQEEVKQNDSHKVLISGGKVIKTYIQKKGSVVKTGERIATIGEVLNHHKLELVASAGIFKIPVYKLPEVYIINTGSELTMPGLPLKPGKIYNSNRVMLSGVLQRENCIALTGENTVVDDLPVICQQLEKGIRNSDLVIITGGAADGDFDLVPAAIKKIGARLLFTSLNLRPGHKSSAGLKEGKLIFNLPGNPGGGEILFEVLIKPVLSKLRGIHNFNNQWFSITLKDELGKASDNRIMYRGQLVEEEGILGAELLGRNQPCTGIAELILDIKSGAGKGDVVRALLI